MSSNHSRENRPRLSDVPFFNFLHQIISLKNVIAMIRKLTSVYNIPVINSQAFFTKEFLTWDLKMSNQLLSMRFPSHLVKAQMHIVPLLQTSKLTVSATSRLPRFDRILTLISSSWRTRFRELKFDQLSSRLELCEWKLSLILINYRVGKIAMFNVLCCVSPENIAQSFLFSNFKWDRRVLGVFVENVHWN